MGFRHSFTARAVATIGAWGGGAKAPPPMGLAPPPIILVIVQYSLIAIAKILLLNAVNGPFDSYAKMYFVLVALQFSRENTDPGINHSFHTVHVLVASKAIIIFSHQIGIGYEIIYCHTLVYVK